jgi:hypothetical protein
MFVHHLLAASTVDTYTLTSGRLLATGAALVAVAGAIVGAVALARSGHRARAIFALAAGLTAMVIGGVVIATADGGPGTGSGVVGGYAALAVGLLATVLGGLALTRSRRAL